MEQGWNADKHGCKDCIYRNATVKEQLHGCSYILIMNQSRGRGAEDAADCTKYVRDKKIRRKKKVK